MLVIYSLFNTIIVHLVYMNAFCGSEVSHSIRELNNCLPVISDFVFIIVNVIIK